jgi:HAD superfamily hydrolase (TIGR01509 family)
VTRESAPKAVLWDNDGLLVDTEQLFFQATSEALARLGVEVTLEQYVDHVMREGASLFDLALARGVDEGEVRRTRAQRNERYGALLADGVRVLDGVVEVLSELDGQLPMACVTTSLREHFDVIHAPHGLLRHFEFVLAHGDYERTKPEPDPYLAAAERFDLEPAECIVIEDSERGLRAAVAAGMRCLVVPNAFTRHSDFAGAHRVLESVREVPAVLAMRS